MSTERRPRPENSSGKETSPQPAMGADDPLAGLEVEKGRLREPVGLVVGRGLGASLARRACRGLRVLLGRGLGLGRSSAEPG